MDDYLTALTSRIYGKEQGKVLSYAIEKILSDFDIHHAPEKWNEKTAIFITYGDSVHDGDEKPLKTLRKWLDKHVMQDITPVVHILPYNPYTSDGGFSISDFSRVDEKLGTWNDIKGIANNFTIMSDMVCNHTSKSHQWFKGMVDDNAEYDGFYVTANPNDDRLKQVTRARAHPLLTPFKTASGEKIHVWTTFSPDQVDLNYRNPAVLLMMLKAVLTYIAQGTRYIRLDAAHCLWKELGTSCMTLPQTHDLCRLYRYVIESCGGILITETNLPHDENISYFGDGDEAHMVYNFAMPALLLYTMQTGDAGYLTGWAKKLDYKDGCTYLNFTACHDGFGLRALECYLGLEKLQEFADQLEQKTGAKINYRLHGSGKATPYEACGTAFSLMNRGDSKEMHYKRFVCMETLKILMRGIPAFYINGFIAAQNDNEGWARTEHNRDLNRQKWSLEALEEQMDNPATDTLMALMRGRAQNPAFHPDGGQIIHDLGKEFFAITRIAPDNSAAINAVANVTDKDVTVNWNGQTLAFAPYEIKQFALSASQAHALAKAA